MALTPELPHVLLAEIPVLIYSTRQTEVSDAGQSHYPLKGAQ